MNNLTIMCTAEAVENGFISKNFTEGVVMYAKIGERNTCKCAKCGTPLKGVLHRVVSNHKQFKGISICGDCYSKNSNAVCYQANTNSISDYVASSVKPFILEVRTMNKDLQRALSFHGIMKTTVKGTYSIMKSDVLYTRQSASSIVKKALQGSAKVFVNGVQIATFEEYKNLTTR